MVKLTIRSANFKLPLPNDGFVYHLMFYNNEIFYNQLLTWTESIDVDNGNILLEQIIPEHVSPTSFAHNDSNDGRYLVPRNLSEAKQFTLTALPNSIDEIEIENNICIAMKLSLLISKKFKLTNRSNLVIRMSTGKMDQIELPGPSHLTINNSGTGLLYIEGRSEFCRIEEGNIDSYLNMNNYNWIQEFTTTRDNQMQICHHSVNQFLQQRQMITHDDDYDGNPLLRFIGLDEVLANYARIFSLDREPNANEIARAQEVEAMVIPVPPEYKEEEGSTSSSSSRKRTVREESSSSSSSEPKRLCMIMACDNNEADARIIPCGCETACLKCLEEYRKAHNNGFRCPTCRKFIEKVEDIHAIVDDV